MFPKHESLARSFDGELKKRNRGLLFSEVDGDVAGHVIYSWPSLLCASITKIAVFCFGETKLVKENLRGQGYGEELLKAAMQQCRTRRVHCISLHVDPLRTTTMTFFKKLGFRADDPREGYYSPD